jgi:hypothetical protein
MAKQQKGMTVTPTENWVAETYSPPYQFINSNSEIQSLEPATRVPYESKKVIDKKTVYLIHSGDTFRVSLVNLPAPCTGMPTLVLIKLPSATHGWENGQHFVDLPFRTVDNNPSQIEFRVPDAQQGNIPPGFYMMFYALASR